MWMDFEVIVEYRSLWSAELSPFFAEYCFGDVAHRSLGIDDIKPSDMLEFFVVYSSAQWGTYRGWWINLGKDDTERSKAFDMLSQARMDWAVFPHMALGRALRDVRACVLNPVRAKLFPPNKKRVIETTASSSSAVKEIEKTSPDEF